MPVLPLPVGAALTRVTSLVGERILAARAETGCTALQLQALRVARDEPTMSTIGERLGVTRSSATSLVDQLVAAGLVTRRVDATDRRRQRVSATSSGITLLGDFDRRIRESVRELVDELSPRQQARLMRLLRDIPDPVGLLPLG